MKRFLIIVLLMGGIGLGLVLAARLFLGGDEDTWICAEGKWVKHGNPGSPKPQIGCGTAPTIVAGGDKVELEIQSLLAKKYNKPISEVKITISKQDDNYVGGSVLFGQGGPGEGGMFLARKAGNIWEIVFDGNGNVDCTKMRQNYGFPDTILKPSFCN